MTPARECTGAFRLIVQGIQAYIHTKMREKEYLLGLYGHITGATRPIAVK